MKLRVIGAAAAGALAGAIIVLAVPAPGARNTTAEKSPPVRRVAAETLLAWTHVALPPGFAAAVRRIPGVKNVTEVRSGVVWLTAWTTGDGKTTRAPAGYRLPVEVAALDTTTYDAFVPPVDRASFDQLARGGALVGSSEAALRRIRSGARLAFDSVSLNVHGVVPDELIGAQEVAVSVSMGAALGVVRPRYLLIRLDNPARIRDVERAVIAAAPPGVGVRVRAPGETPVFRQGDAVLAPVKLKELFGEFAATVDRSGSLRVDPAWVAANIATATFPRIGRMTCHKRLMPQLRGALEEIAQRGLDNLVDPAQYAGCFVPKFLSEDAGEGISHHAWGVAFDINASDNPFGREPRMDPRLVAVFERWGFTWGGRWLVPDGMHFEFRRFPLAPR